MTDKTRVKIDLAGFEKIRETLGKDYYVKVGVLGNAKNVRNGDGITNAEAAVIHIFGSVTNNIPPRDFLVMPIETHAKEIVQFLDTSKVKRLITEGKIVDVYKSLGVIAEGYVLGAFASGGYGKWPALKDATVRRKGSSKPLIDTGQLRRSVTSQVVENK
jgi:phage gpG-like protein